MVNNEAIVAELGKHPYTPEDKITFAGASHYCKVFKLGSGKIEIVYKSGNAGAICEAMSTTECIDKNGIIVDGTDVYVLKETSPRGTFARYVVLETNTGKQLKGVVDASSVSLTKGYSSVNPSPSSMKGQCVISDGEKMIASPYHNAIEKYNLDGQTDADTEKKCVIKLGTRIVKGNMKGQFSCDFKFANNTHTICTGSITSQFAFADFVSEQAFKTNPWNGIVDAILTMNLNNHGRIWGQNQNVNPYIFNNYETLKMYGDARGTSVDNAEVDIYLVFTSKTGLNITNRFPQIELLNIWGDEGWKDWEFGKTQYASSAQATALPATAVEVTNAYGHSYRKNNINVPVPDNNNQMLVSDVYGNWTKLNAGTEGQVLMIVDGAPKWTSIA